MREKAKSGWRARWNFINYLSVENSEKAFSWFPPLCPSLTYFNHNFACLRLLFEPDLVIYDLSLAHPFAILPTHSLIELRVGGIGGKSDRKEGLLIPNLKSWSSARRLREFREYGFSHCASSLDPCSSSIEFARRRCFDEAFQFIERNLYLEGNWGE